MDRDIAAELRQIAKLFGEESPLGRAFLGIADEFEAVEQRIARLEAEALPREAEIT